MEDEELDYGEEDYELKIDDEDDQDLLEGELDEAKYFDEDEEIDIYNDVDTTLKPDEKTSENKLDSTIVKKEVNLTKEDEKLKQDIKDGESSDTNAKQPKSQAAAAQRKTVTKETRKVVQTDGRRAASSEARYLLISEVNWWTTDSEIEAALSEFGTVKEIKFVEEKASGKSKGLCQVEMQSAEEAQKCKENLSGRPFSGRNCSISLGTLQAINQLINQYNSGILPNRTGPYRTDKGRTEMYGQGAATGPRGPPGQYNRPMGGRGGPPPLGMVGRGGGPMEGAGRGGRMGRMGGHFPPPPGPFPPFEFGPMGGRGFMGFPGGPFPPMGMEGGPHFMGPGGFPGVAPHINPAFFGRGEEGSHFEGKGKKGDGEEMGEGEVGKRKRTS